MARNDTIPLAPRTWVELTNGNASAARVMNVGGLEVYLMVTVGANQPSSLAGAIPLRSMDIITGDLSFTELWPGVAGANRLYGFCEGHGAVSVSHADA